VIVSLIGMSNIGKSYWARRITSALNCPRIDCDGLIEAKLAPELEQGGFHGLRGMGQWMGLPDAPQHARHSEMYRMAEQEVMRDCLAELQNKQTTAAVVDTTGSVIYTDDATRDHLRALTRVIYFEASTDHIDRLFRHYINNPKPTLWGGMYQPHDGETALQTLKRCYPLLLAERAQRYNSLAHVIIPYEQHHKRGASVHAMLEELGIPS
jgi:shikimate kinase